MSEPTTPTEAELNQAIAVATQAYIKARTARPPRDPAAIAAAKDAVDALIALRDQLYP
jgi:hypothetical protein